MKRAIIIFSILLCSTISVAETFPSQNVNTNPVGFQSDEDYLLTYPGISDGEKVAMAQNGPFAIVVFIPDDGEDLDQYTWLQSELSKWGYIVLVPSEDLVSDWDEIIQLLNSWNNGSILEGSSAGMFALEHIAVSGHGTGAHTAAELLRSGQFVIDGLFGLGFDGSSTDYPDASSNLLSRPSSALFLTGTNDEIAEASENVIPYLNDWPGAWQVMQPLGANHLQYQEESGFIEGLIDGDASISESEQRNNAFHHILPYLNLSLRGDDSAYQQAFNREDKTTSSDSDSYIEEDLSRSRLYNITGMSSSLNSIMKSDDFTILANVTMRDGSIANGNVTCEASNGIMVDGILDSGIASCELNGTMLNPGPQIVKIYVADHSFSDWQELQVNRIGSPMIIADPLPDIILNQHGNITMALSDIATDPDQQNITIVNASILGDNLSRLEVNYAGITEPIITISHVADQEWSGTLLLSLTINAGLGDWANLSLLVIVLPVDDQVVLNSNVSQQQSIEDGENIIVDFSDYATDPEGSPIVVSTDRDYAGLRIEVVDSVALIDPHENWNGAELLYFQLSDGLTESITASVPINVVAVDDPILFVSDTYELELDEDGADTIDLTSLTIDVDGDVLNYSISGNSNITSVGISGTILTYAGSPNMHGISEYILNVSDGNSSAEMSILIDVKSVADLPSVAITSFSVIEQDVALLWVLSDEDGLENLIFNITYDGQPVNDNTICTGDTQLTCSTLFIRPESEPGIVRIEIKVWDSQALQWSNTAYQDVEFSKTTPSSTDSTSEESIGLWILPVGLAVVAILLFAIIRQSSSKD